MQINCIQCVQNVAEKSINGANNKTMSLLRNMNYNDYILSSALSIMYIAHLESCESSDPKIAMRSHFKEKRAHCVT